jgi:hypothetical protein
MIIFYFLPVLGRLRKEDGSSRPSWATKQVPASLEYIDSISKTTMTKVFYFHLFFN